MYIYLCESQSFVLDRVSDDIFGKVRRFWSALTGYNEVWFSKGLGNAFCH